MSPPRMSSTPRPAVDSQVGTAKTHARGFSTPRIREDAERFSSTGVDSKNVLH